jgi:hypothetical protein
MDEEVDELLKEYFAAGRSAQEVDPRVNNSPKWTRPMIQR